MGCGSSQTLPPPEHSEASRKTFTRAPVKSYIVQSRRIGRGKYPCLPRFEELPPAIIRDFVNMGVLGQGRFSDVFRVRKRSRVDDTTRQWNVHRTKVASAPASDTESWKNEAEVFCVVALNSARLKPQDEMDLGLMIELCGRWRIDHPNILRHFSWSSSSQFTCIVTEYCQGGSVAARADTYLTLQYPEGDAARIAGQVLSGLSALHSRGVVHRNISAHHCLFKDHNTVDNLKITGFEYAVVLPSTQNSIWGDPRVVHRWPENYNNSPFSVAPETLRRCEYRTASDLWALGVMLYEMLFASVPFFGRNRTSLKRAIEFMEPDIGENEVSHACRDLLRGLLTKDPEYRLSAEEALRHPWIQRTEECVNEWLKGAPAGVRSASCRRLSTSSVDEDECAEKERSQMPRKSVLLDQATVTKLRELTNAGGPTSSTTASVPDNHINSAPHFGMRSIQ